MTLHRYMADLHIHTCLSWCASLDTYPEKMVEEAERKGPDIIAITDHNAVSNCRWAVRAARQRGLLVLPGMELTTSVEVHLVIIFPNLRVARAFERVVLFRD